METRKILVITFSLVFVLVMVLGFYLAGSPAENAKINEDKQRIRDLSWIKREIDSEYREDCKLPKDIDFLEPLESNNRYAAKFPISDYRYEITSKKQYKLCANFHFDYEKYRNDSYYNDTSFDNYKTGNFCFDLEAEIYGDKCKDKDGK